jgi:hypothetical protein
MKKYSYNWLIEQYLQEFGVFANSKVQEAIVEFIESGKSREIYYELARMLYYRKSIWHIRLLAYFLVKKATKRTVLAPLSRVITKKILTDAKAKALSNCYR